MSSMSIWFLNSIFVTIFNCKHFLFITFLLLCFLKILPSQETQKSNSRIAEDVESASLKDLLRIASKAQIDMTGNTEELRNRIYNHYKLDTSKKEKNINATAEEVFSGKIADLNETVSVFKGNVELEILENGKLHKIRAQIVKIYPEMNTIYAGENIEYKYDNQQFTAKNMIFNSDNLSSLSISIRGSYDVKNLADEKLQNIEIIYFNGDNIHKTSTGFIILDNTIATSCNKEEYPHYRLKFSKLWFNEEKKELIAKNLSLYLGHIPFFYLPIYYHSDDVLFFHPIIGYRNPSGFFYHTTTYLYDGKKRIIKKDKNNPDKNKDPDDISDEIPKTPKSTDKGHLKFLLDYYSKLGVFSGLQGYIPQTNTDAKVGIAYSNTIFDGNSLYPSSGPILKEVNTSTWFKKTYPFRFGADVTGNIWGVNYRIEYYSDPYFHSDFWQRHEKASLFAFILSLEPEYVKKERYETKSFFSYKKSWSFPRVGINSLSIDYLDFEFMSGTAINSEINFSESPNYYFYTPSSFNIPNLQTSLDAAWIMWETKDRKKIEDEKKKNDDKKTNEQDENKEEEKDISKRKVFTINQLENLKIIDDSPMT